MESSGRSPTKHTHQTDQLQNRLLPVWATINTVGRTISCAHRLGSHNMNDEYQWIDRGYGKNNVKILHVRREGVVHSIKEYEINTQLTLNNDKDYIFGDNSDIIATDSQKNTVYILAKKHGIVSPEDFALLLCTHFLSKYPYVEKAKIDVDAYPWRRIVSEGKAHNHAFLLSPEIQHTCTVSQRRGEAPLLSTGLTGMRVLKTTQSAFVNFVDDEFRSLPDMKDRIFSTIITASWQYNTVDGVDFGKIWANVYKLVIDKFAGNPDTGIFSPSVQNTIYLLQKAALDEIPEISKISVTMPNKHYYTVDLSKFPEVGSLENNEVFLPMDKPAGNITAVLGRATKSKL
ncbi:uricase-like [Macrobrachium nipponense]|uniref:uricase-like n=1 Tax=Macrobrachium nipponense TaxID=159736 RepID=UPI0030C884DB